MSLPEPLDPHVVSALRSCDRTLPTLAENLALDEALLAAAEAGAIGPVVRTWEFPAPAVVLGASGRLHEDVNVASCQAEGVEIGRRSSGGGTVLIGPGALNLTVVLPATAARGLDAVDSAQAFVLERLAITLRGRGPAVELRGSGDLTLGDRKFAGSAQRRLRRHFLVHTSVLYAFPLDAITRLTRLPRRQPAYRANRPHADFLTNLPLPRVELLAAMHDAWPGPAVDPSAWDAAEGLVAELVASKFGRLDWIERL